MPEFKFNLNDEVTHTPTATEGRVAALFVRYGESAKECDLTLSVE